MVREGEIARFAELWKALSTADGRPQGLSLEPARVGRDGERIDPDRGLVVDFQPDPDGPRLRYFLNRSAPEFQAFHPKNGMLHLKRFPFDLSSGYQVLGTEHTSARRAAAAILRNARERWDDVAD